MKIIRHMSLPFMKQTIKMPLIIILFLLANSAFANGSAEMLSSHKTSAPYSLQLTAKEKAWIARHKKIRVAFDDSLPPFSFVDKDGQFKGIAVDIINALSQKLAFKVKHYPRMSWNQIYRAVAEQRVDVVATMVDRPARRLLFNFTHPYLTKSLAIITHENDTRIKDPSDLDGKTIAYVKGYQFTESLKDNYPSIKPHVVKSMLACLKSVSRKKSDACITFVGTATYYQTKNMVTGIKIAGFYERNTADESIAIRGDWPILAGILQKGLDAMSEAEMKAIHLKWMPPPPAPTLPLPVNVETNKNEVHAIPAAPPRDDDFWKDTLPFVYISAPYLLIFAYVFFWLLRNRRASQQPRRVNLERESTKQRIRELPKDFEQMLLKRATELKNSDTRFRNLVENQSKNYFFFQCDKQGKLTYVSPSVSQMLGYRPEKFITNFQNYVTNNPENRKIVNLMELSCQGIPCQPCQLEVYDSDKERRWLELTSEPVYDEFGNCIGVDCLVFEITKRKLEDERLIWLSFHDELTGLANRRLFAERLHQAIATANRNHIPFAIHYLDLDGFKSVNDKLGHAAGDYALKEVAKKLSQTLRDTDTIARFGGDEFALLLPDTDQKASTNVAEKIVEILQEPIGYGEKSIQFGVSIGIAIYPHHGADSDALLNYADASMYHAKQKQLGYSFKM